MCVEVMLKGWVVERMVLKGCRSMTVVGWSDVDGMPV